MHVVVTGGAGFIGSHLVDALVAQGNEVRIIDDLSTGRRENLHPRAALLEIDVADAPAVAEAVAGADVIFHLAADGSVAHSVDDPLTTDRSNVRGTLAVLGAARSSGVRRVVFASSCSVYGDVTTPPVAETAPLSPMSPYAVTKLTGEHYCRVFAEIMGVETVALRFFNVYGPRQRADSVYAAVIPKFADALRSGTDPTIFGDGRQRRDFVSVDDVVAVTVLAAGAPEDRCSGKVFNVGAGAMVDLLELLETMGRILDVEPTPNHADPRPGDVRESGADITAAREALGYEPVVSLEDGLRHMLLGE